MGFQVMKSRINNLQSTMDELKVSVANIVETIISEGGSALKNTHAQRPAPAKPLDGKETTTTNVMHMNIDECEEDFDTEENLKCIVKNKSCQGKTGVNADTSPGQVKTIKEPSFFIVISIFMLQNVDCCHPEPYLL